MSIAFYPPIPPQELLQHEEDTLALELQWLLRSMQETLVSLKSGLEECAVLLAPSEPGSTLVVSSPRSESIKGFLTRVGIRIVKGDMLVRLPSLPSPPGRVAPGYPLRLSVLPSAPPLIMHQLAKARSLIDQALDVVDISAWTGDPRDANFIAGQLRLLAELVNEAQVALRGEDETATPWWEGGVDAETFSPPLPPNLSFHLSITDASLTLHIRTLAPTDPPSPSASASSTSTSRPPTPHANTSRSNTPPTTTSTYLNVAGTALSLRQRLGLAARLPVHDESGRIFAWRGGGAIVREKVRVESQDPSLMALMAKLSAVGHAVRVARGGLAVCMGEEE